MAEALAGGMSDRWAVVLGPVAAQGTSGMSVLNPPRHLEPPVRVSQRAVLQGVAGQLVQGHADWNRELGWQDDPRVV
jgi:hypothetical protein